MICRSSSNSSKGFLYNLANYHRNSNILIPNFSHDFHIMIDMLISDIIDPNMGILLGARHLFSARKLYKSKIIMPIY